jgi:hypothetical protein
LDISLVPHASTTFTVKRDPGTEARITVNLENAYPDDLTIPADPKIATPPQTVTDPKIVEIVTTAGGSDAASHPVTENAWEVNFPITDTNHIGIRVCG